MPNLPPLPKEYEVYTLLKQGDFTHPTEIEIREFMNFQHTRGFEIVQALFNPEGNLLVILKRT
jgi:hypothetical protein